MRKLLRGEPYADRPYTSVPMNLSFDRDTALLICQLAPNLKARSAFLTRLVYAEVGRLEERQKIIEGLMQQR
jgi:hypothetical protein